MLFKAEVVTFPRVFWRLSSSSGVNWGQTEGSVLTLHKDTAGRWLSTGQIWHSNEMQISHRLLDTHTHTHRFSGKCDPTAHGGDVLPFCLSRAIRKFQFIFQCAGGGQQESLRLYIHFRFLGRRVAAGLSRLRCCSSVRLPRICVAHKAALLPRPPLSPPLPSPPLPPPESTTSCCGLKGQSSIYTQTPNKRRELQLGGAPKLPQTPSETSVQD